MKDYVNIGSSPYDECCAQVGELDYYHKAQKDCRAFARQLIRQFGKPPEGARVAIKSFPHDFGTYWEVVCWYNDKFPESEDYAFKLEAETPAKWDKEAIKELTKPCSCSYSSGSELFGEPNNSTGEQTYKVAWLPGGI